ncbi:MAG: hypothetical protein AAFU73_00890 [Planctomycetota bacterium]
MTDNPMNHADLEARLARLETENARIKRRGRFLAGGLGALALMSFAAPTLCEIVWAERFVLRDASNRTRVSFNAYGTDTPTMKLHDARGKEVARIGLTPDGTLAMHVMKEGKAQKASLVLDDGGDMRFTALGEGGCASGDHETEEVATKPRDIN